jgi:hypothetical protein
MLWRGSASRPRADLQRDGMLAKMAPASVNRYCKVIKAALNLAANSDRRIKNAHAWTTGLQLLPDANEVNSVILADPQVISFVGAAYAQDEKLGELTDVLAQSGARPSQAARLYVRDLIAHKTEPRLMMPKSAKGGGLNRTSKKVERYSVHITPALAERLAKAAKGRPASAPLLVRSNGKTWASMARASRTTIARTSRRSSRSSASIRTRSRYTRCAIARLSATSCSTSPSGSLPQATTRALWKSSGPIRSSSPSIPAASRAAPCSTVGPRSLPITCCS